MDHVILSSNNSSNYLPYWPVVASAWKKLFNVIPILAYVDESNAMCEKLSEFGEVIHIIPVPNIPICNQSKIARLFLASQYKSKICLINDIDLLPLCHSYTSNILSKRNPNELLCIGAEVYKNSPDEGKFPMGYITAEGSVFKEIVNPQDLPFDAFVRQFVGMKEIDHKEDVMNLLPPGETDCFSDESLMRVLIRKANPKVCHIERGWQPYTEKAICRASWDKWTLDELKNGKYVECHLPHPYNLEQIKPILTYIGLENICQLSMS